jgi:ABC-type Co2+ transport system permease subunit
MKSGTVNRAFFAFLASLVVVSAFAKSTDRRASANRWVPLLGISAPRHAIVSDVKMPSFMLSVIHTALFFLLQDKRGGS